MNTKKLFEITDRELLEAYLVVSGYASGCADGLAGKQESMPGYESMLLDLKMEIAQSLSLGWIAHRLREVADGSDGVAAVAALEQLIKLSHQAEVLFKPDLFLNKLR